MSKNAERARHTIDDLLGIMARLRDPDRGCPWDLEQSFETIAPYTIEEAYEVADAIDRDALDELAGELGDLLLQVVYHAQMARERGAFDFGDVVDTICRKMVKRHPHVFGDAPVGNAEAQSQQWEAQKAVERERSGSKRVLDGVPKALPSLMRAEKLGRRASRVGFDWPDARGVRDKVEEELGELDRAVSSGDPAAVAAEAGDVLFALANLCRHLSLDPEESLRGANARFERRFEHVESRAAKNGGWDAQSPEDLERYWSEAKRRSAS